MLRKLAAELLGTLILVFVACGVATLSFGKGFNFAGFPAAHNLSAGIVATALTFGLVLLSLVYVLGPISGCHVNPAVTVGALLTRRIEPVEGLLYMVAQFIGGILGALLLWGYSVLPPSTTGRSPASEQTGTARRRTSTSASVEPSWSK